MSRLKLKFLLEKYDTRRKTIANGIKIHHYQGSDCVLKSIDLRTYAAYVEVYEFNVTQGFYPRWTTKYF